MSVTEQEQTQHILQAYHQACRESDSEGACTRFIKSLTASLYGQIIYEALAEANKKLPTSSQQFEIDTFEEDITLVRELCKLNPIYSADNVQMTLPLLTSFCRSGFTSGYYSHAVIEVLGSLEEYLRQPDVLTQC